MEHFRLTASAWPDFRAEGREVLDDGPLTVREPGEALAAHRGYRHLGPVCDEGAVTAYLRTHGPATFDHVDYWLGNGQRGTPTARRLDRRVG